MSDIDSTESEPYLEDSLFYKTVHNTVALIVELKEKNKMFLSSFSHESNLAMSQDMDNNQNLNNSVASYHSLQVEDNPKGILRPC